MMLVYNLYGKLQKTILTKSEMIVERTPEELRLWVEKKCREFASLNKVKQNALLRKGLFKKFYEEIYLLSLFANKLYSNRSDIICIPNLANGNFDAIIRDNSLSPPSELKVEFTMAINGHDEALRMEYFIKHGHVNMLGKLSHIGTKKKGHTIYIENEAVRHSDVLKNIFSLIEERAKLKSDRPYGNNHVLVITFDDYFGFDSEDDVKALKEFVKSNVLILPINFRAVYLVGLSGKTFLSSKLTRNYNNTN